MFPIDSFINLPSAPLGASIERSPQLSLGSFNRSLLLNARVQPSAPLVRNQSVPKRPRNRARAGPACMQQPHARPQRFSRSGHRA